MPRFETSLGFCGSRAELAAARDRFAASGAFRQRTALLEVGRPEPKRGTQVSITRTVAFRSPSASGIL
jgi:hypothetical protein